MSRRALILVEGQTEERFVKTVLAPHFYHRQLFFSPTILHTKRVKDGPSFKGGLTGFGKFENDARKVLGGAGGALVTTLLDYYALPSDFPGMGSRPPHGTALQRVKHVETAILQHFGSLPNFLPFLALHEFEAWLFSSGAELPRVLNEVNKQPEFEAIRARVKTPEEINERPQFAPSKRIEAMFPAYRKTLHGPITAERIGLEKIRAACPHFNDWMEKMELLAV